MSMFPFSIPNAQMMLAFLCQNCIILAFLYNFCLFFSWIVSKSRQPLVLCVTFCGQILQRTLAMRRTQNTSHITQSGGAHTFTGNFDYKLYQKMSLLLSQKFVSKFVQICFSKFVKKSVPKLLKKQEERRTFLT